MWNLHPDGGFTGLGISPLMTVSTRFAVGSGTGTASINAFVYGCRGSNMTCSVSPLSIILPKYIIANRSHMCRERAKSWVM